MRYFNSFRALLAAVIAIFATFAVIGQSPQSFSRQINGQVRYADSRTPAEDALVRAESNSGGMIGQVVTDRTGKFSFTGLRAEQISIVIHKPGYHDYQETVDLMTSATGYINAQLVRDKTSLVSTNSLEPIATKNGVIDANTPAEAQSEYSKAKALIDEGKTREGIAALERAIAIYPKFAEAQLMLGLAQMDLKQWDKAESALNGAIGSNPDVSTAYVALGEVYRQEKKYTDAEKILLDGLKHNADSAEGHALLAQVYWDMAPASATEQMFKNRLQSSYNEVNKALKLKPGLADAHLLAGNLLFKAHRADQALPHFEEYLRLQPNGAFAADVRTLVEKIKQAMAAKNGKT